MNDSLAVDVGASEDLVDGGPGLRFPVCVGGRPATGFAVRYAGRVHAYLNRCAHVAMELDWLEGAFFDEDALHLVCATHGALFEPDTGRCAGGPCAGRGGLRPLQIEERDGRLLWRPDPGVQPG